MREVNFRELYAKQTWEERAKVLDVRARIFRVLDYMEKVTESYKEAKKKHKKGVKEYKQTLKDLAASLEEAENDLQRAWGLEADPNWHTYWLAPSACTCPRLDNYDRLGFGRIFSADCPIHGK